IPEKKQQYDSKLKAKLEGTSPAASAVRKAMPVAKPLPTPSPAAAPQPVAAQDTALPETSFPVVTEEPSPELLISPATISPGAVASRNVKPKSKASSGSLIPLVIAAVAVVAIAAIGGVIYFASSGSQPGPKLAQKTKPKPVPTTPASTEQPEVTPPDNSAPKV